MNNGQLIIDNEKRNSERDELPITNYQLSIEKNCPACGATASRESAKYCSVCAKFLKEDYQPLDALRSSNRLQGQTFLVENAKREEVTNLFPRNENAISETAWALLVYSLVPYLGILFVPLAFITGVSGAAISLRRPNAGGGKLAFVCAALSVVVLIIQIFLWWLLYFVPEIGKQI